ncbi:MAG: AI-2E family transporter [Planctomycetota bacterium]|jgi:predicted PurR-regulated permease PerM
MDRRVFTAFLLAVLVIGLIVLTFTIFQPFLLALLWAAVLATVTYPPYEWLTRRLRGRRGLSAVLMTVLVLLLLLGPFFSLTLVFYEDAAGFVDGLSSEELKDKLDRILAHEWLQVPLQKVEEATGQQVDRAVILSHIRSVLGGVAQAAGDVVKFLFGLLAGIFFVTLAIFYFYRDGPKVVKVMRELVPLSEADRDTIFGDIHGAITAAVRGGLVTALVQGVLGFIIYFILGLEQPVLAAAITALASFIPLVGTALIWIPIALWFVINGETGKALILAGYGVVVIASSDNLLRPILVGRHMEAHPLLLFFGILGGIATFGFAGIVLGPVAVAFINVTAKLLRREFRRNDDADEVPVPT